MSAPPIRLLFLLDSLRAGGAQRQLFELVTRLNPDLFQPTVIALESDDAAHFVEPLRARGVPVENWHLPWTLRGFIAGQRRLHAAVKRIQPAILHSQIHHSNHLARLAWWHLRPRPRLLLGIRTDYTPRQLLYERWMRPLASRVVCNSPNMFRLLTEQARLDPDRTHLILNGIDTGRFSTPSAPNFRQEIAPGARLLGVMMARTSEQKAPYLLADALGILKSRGQLREDMVFILVGENRDAMVQERLLGSIARHDLARTLLLHRPTIQPEAYYHASDFTLLTSLWEGLPNAALESMAAGRPVLLSEASNHSGAVVSGKHGWTFKTNDPADLADVLSRDVLDRSHWPANLATNCRLRAAEYDLDTMVQHYEALYLSMLDQDTSDQRSLSKPNWLP